MIRRSLIIMYFLMLFTSVFADDFIVHDVDIKAYYLEDLKTGKVIAQKNQDTMLPGASTTKMVTAMIAKKFLKDKSVIRISKAATRVVPTKIYLRWGEKYFFKDLLYAMLINSANDAALAVALHISKNEKTFVKKMNRWCKKNGLSSTRFEDVVGLSPGSVTTAKDISKIFKIFIKDTSFMGIIKKHHYRIQSLKGRRIYFKTSNRFNEFIESDSESIIGKTGFTKRAGFCFSGIVTSGRNRYIVSMLGAQSYWRQLYLLMKYADRAYQQGNRY